MADAFSDKLNAVLGNPEAMGQIMSIARSLSGEGTPPAQSESPPPPQEDYVPTAPSPDPSPLAGLLGGLGGEGGNPLGALSDLDPRILQAGMRLLSEYNGQDDRKTALLTALTPFVKEERFAKMDRAIQLAKLSRMIRIGLEVFKESGGGGDRHV